MIWNIIAYIIIGFLGGAIAKAIVPGKQGGGFWKTAGLGIAGSFVFGFIAKFVFDRSRSTDIFSLYGLFGSIVGAIIVILVYGLLTKKEN